MVDDTIETPKVITFVLLLTISVVHQIFNIQYSLVFKYICLKNLPFFYSLFFKKKNKKKQRPGYKLGSLVRVTVLTSQSIQENVFQTGKYAVDSHHLLVRTASIILSYYTHSTKNSLGCAMTIFFFLRTLTRGH